MQVTVHHKHGPGKITTPKCTAVTSFFFTGPIFDAWLAKIIFSEAEMLSRYSQKKRWIEIEGFGSDLNQTSQDRDSWVPHYQFYNTFVEKNLIILELFTEKSQNSQLAVRRRDLPCAPAPGDRD